MVPCAIGQGIESKPQQNMCSPDIGLIMEYKFNAKACLRYDGVISVGRIYSLWK